MDPDTLRARPPAKRTTTTSILRDLEAEKRRQQRPVATSSDLGRVGAIVQDTVTISPNAGHTYLWTPTGAGLLHTTFRVWTEASPSGTWLVACQLDGLGTGRGRGYVNGGSTASLDAGFTAAGTRAAAVVSWTTSDTPDPTEFLIEIVSSPIR